MSNRLGLIGVPSSAGAFAPGQEKGPEALRQAGLVDLLEGSGIQINDHGDSSTWRWRPDKDNRTAMNAKAVVDVAAETANRVRTTLTDDRALLVLGGDCTIGIGVVAGCQTDDEKIGLLYFDLHGDLNVPGAVSAGALDWMGVAHMLDVDGANDAIAGIGARRPLLKPDEVLYFAYGPDNLTDFESKTFQRLGLEGIPVSEVAENPAAAARRAVDQLESRFDGYALHFDVDTVDFLDMPLSENSGHNEGLTFDAAMEAFGVLLGSELLRTITITEYNPDHGDADGSTARGFAQALAASFSRNLF
jgi:arginase